MEESAQTIFAKKENAGQVFVSLRFLNIGAEVIRVYEREYFVAWDGLNTVPWSSMNMRSLHKVDRMNA
jgi:hypothetical protein